MNFKTLAAPLALKILRMLLTNIGTAITTFLVARHLVAAGDELTYVNLLADCAPALMGAIPGGSYQIWLWLNRFEFVGRVEAALHLPVTGKPSPVTVQAAQTAQNLALASLPPIAKSVTMALLLAALCLPSCAYLPPAHGTAPTAKQQAISNALQSIANEIRKAETAAVTPAKLAADLAVVSLVLPEAEPYIAGAEAAYSAALVAGNLSVAAGEDLARAYDS